MVKGATGEEIMTGPVRAAGLVCAAIASDPRASDPQAEALRAAKLSEPAADVLEIRLDSIPWPLIGPFIQELRKPLLFTNRPTWEGGHYDGDETARITLLLEAMQAGAAYVDIELKTAPALRQQVLDAAAGLRTRVIISWHDFQGTPSRRELERIFSDQLVSGAHIGKIVTLAHNFADVLRVLDLQVLAAEEEFPLIAFCMGRAGIISRVATVELGGYMTYAAAESGRTTAPGQLRVSVLRDLLRSFAEAEGEGN